MKKILAYFVILTSHLFAQVNVPPPYVVNSAGHKDTLVGSYRYSFNIGEPITGTAKTNANYYTQGFLQPDYKIGTAFNASVYFTNESCQGAADGSIVSNAYNGHGPIKYAIYPSPSLADTTSATHNLPPNTYTITIVDSLNNTLTRTITIAASSETCPITVHHAFSPNHDGLNDLYIIDGIENYSNNHVYFFNRWGQAVWDKAKYDNVKVVWNGKDNNGIELSAGTYFYVIELDGKKPQKGWVEITK